MHGNSGVFVFRSLFFFSLPVWRVGSELHKFGLQSIRNSVYVSRQYTTMEFASGLG